MRNHTLAMADYAASTAIVKTPTAARAFVVGFVL
jgi:hypothetical protein